MNFIRNHNYMMFPAQIANPPQFLPVPDSSYRIVGITQNHQGSLRIGKFLFQILKIHMISVSVILQRTLYNISSVIHNRIEENIVNRCLYQHIFPHCRQLAYHTGNGRNHPCTENKPLFFHGKIMPPLPPAQISLIPFFWHNGIAKYTMGGSLLDGCLDFWRCLKIHICHPHRQLMLFYIPFQ